MRQLCNVSFAVQAEGKADEAAFERWRADLERAPEGEAPAPRTQITTQLDGLMPALVPPGGEG